MKKKKKQKGMAGKKSNSARESLLHLSKKDNEAEIQNKIAAWLSECGIKCKPEQHVGRQRMDLYSMDHKFIIETKTYDVLSKGIERKTGRDSKSVFEQLSEYVNAERIISRLNEKNLQWMGIITDGKRWWAWYFPLAGQGGKPQSIGGWSGLELDKQNIGVLEKLLHRDKTTPSGNDLVSEFKPIHEKLNELYSKRSSKLSTKTQKHLWLEQLKGSGNSPKEDDEDALFATHTMLILISRMVSGVKKDDAKLLEGFVSWTENSNEIDGLYEIIERYDWGATDGDVLRQLYGGFIPAEQRRAYGEYYTPDWLAEKICNNTIDDEFIIRQLDRFSNDKPVQGILDPACGSGTFLYHASRRLKNSKPVKDAYMDTSDINDFICEMIRGIDIHPVAVEMARANLHRFLDLETSRFKIYQGDALLAGHQDRSTILSQEGNLVLVSPNNRILVIPEKFLREQTNINKFVRSAIDKKDLPPASYVGLPDGDKETLKKSHKIMTDIIIDEGNGVWAWYIHNQAAPLLMAGSEKIGRIVSNPPWVTLKRMDDPKRSEVLKRLGSKLGIYTGGKYAPQFDVASIFVVRCRSEYLHETGKVGWVLPQSARIGSGQWQKIRDKYEKPTYFVDMGNLAFREQSKSVIMFEDPKGVDRTDKRMQLKDKMNINEHDSWQDVKNRVEFSSIDDQSNIKPSAWLDTSGKPIARNGATLFPQVLVFVESMTVKNDVVNVVTSKAKGPWKVLEKQTGWVPKEFVKQCLFSKNLIPYYLPTVSNVIIPINDNFEWIKDRKKNKFWRDVSAIYEDYATAGSPETLEKQLNTNGKLLSQKNLGVSVVYNLSGSRLYAAINHKKNIIDNTLIRVPCDSLDEAYYLMAVLNADCIQGTVIGGRSTDRHITTKFWRKIPIMRYNVDDDADHKELVKLSRRAEKAVEENYDINGTNPRNKAIQCLRNNGISRQIDDVVRRLLPNHIKYREESNLE